MKGRELDRLLADVEEAEDLRGRLRRARALEDEIARDDDVARRAPDVRAAAAERRGAVERVARSLEEQWVAQGPLVALWELAVEAREEAESVGVEPGPFAEDVDTARQRVEAARLATRDQSERLGRE